MSGIVALATVALFTPVQAHAQTNSDPVPTIGKIVDTTVSAIKGSQSNVWWAAYYMHAPSLKHKDGGGIGVFWQATSLDSTNVSLRLLAGTRVDDVDNSFWMPSGNVTIDLPIKPLAWTGWGWSTNFTVTPLAYAGIGIPLSGATIGNYTVPGKVIDNNGDPTAITGFGVAVRLFEYKRATFEAAYDREKWSGFPGYQDRLGLVLHLRR